MQICNLLPIFNQSNCQNTLAKKNEAQLKKLNMDTVSFSGKKKADYHKEWITNTTVQRLVSSIVESTSKPQMSLDEVATVLNYFGYEQVPGQKGSHIFFEPKAYKGKGYYFTCIKGSSSVNSGAVADLKKAIMDLDKNNGELMPQIPGKTPEEFREMTSLGNYPNDFMETTSSGDYNKLGGNQYRIHFENDQKQKTEKELKVKQEREAQELEAQKQKEKAGEISATKQKQDRVQYANDLALEINNSIAVALSLYNKRCSDIDDLLQKTKDIRSEMEIIADPERSKGPLRKAGLYVRYLKLTEPQTHREDKKSVFDECMDTMTERCESGIKNVIDLHEKIEARGETQHTHITSGNCEDEIAKREKILEGIKKEIARAEKWTITSLIGGPRRYEKYLEICTDVEKMFELIAEDEKPLDPDYRKQLGIPSPIERYKLKYAKSLGKETDQENIDTISNKEVPIEETPAQKTSIEETPVEAESVEETPAEAESVEEAPAQETEEASAVSETPIEPAQEEPKIIEQKPKEKASDSIINIDKIIGSNPSIAIMFDHLKAGISYTSISEANNDLFGIFKNSFNAEDIEKLKNSSKEEYKTFINEEKLPEVKKTNEWIQTTRAIVFAYLETMSKRNPDIADWFNLDSRTISGLIKGIKEGKEQTQIGEQFVSLKGVNLEGVKESYITNRKKLSDKEKEGIIEYISTFKTINKGTKENVLELLGSEYSYMANILNSNTDNNYKIKLLDTLSQDYQKRFNSDSLGGLSDAYRMRMEVDAKKQIINQINYANIFNN